MNRDAWQAVSKLDADQAVHFALKGNVTGRRSLAGNPWLIRRMIAMAINGAKTSHCKSSKINWLNLFEKNKMMRTLIYSHISGFPAKLHHKISYQAKKCSTKEMK